MDPSYPHIRVVPFFGGGEKRPEGTKDAWNTKVKSGDKWKKGSPTPKLTSEEIKKNKKGKEMVQGGKQETAFLAQSVIKEKKKGLRKTCLPL